jgi:hypothetical protein
MKQHEREFFIAMIRTGNTFIKTDDCSLVVKPLTIDQAYEASDVYQQAYQQAYIDGMMSEEEMNQWMIENNLWTDEDEEKSEGFKKDLERLKIEIYNARNNETLKERIRLYLRAGESQFGHHLSKKHVYHQNTAEGYATTEKVAWSIKNSTFVNNELYDFSDHTLAYIVEEWQSSFLHDSHIRELARNEPWKSLWVVRDNTKIRLFNNSENSELTYNQKNLIIWSQMYDNIQESLDCPNKDVIDDDDMLDGWFIIQSKKREQEKAEQDINEASKNSKIKNASEVFVMANTKKDADRINSVNTMHSQVIKKQRDTMLKQKGTVNDHDFVDQRQKIQMEQTNMLRGNIKGGR